VFDMSQANLLGYIAAAFVFVTFWMKTMVPLRVLGIGSNILAVGNHLWTGQAALLPEPNIRVLLPSTNQPPTIRQYKTARVRSCPVALAISRASWVAMRIARITTSLLLLAGPEHGRTILITGQRGTGNSAVQRFAGDRSSRPREHNSFSIGDSGRLSRY